MLSLKAMYHNGILHFENPIKIETPINVIVTFIDENNELEYIFNADNTKNKKKYNFSEIAGKLEWNGNALEQQKELRDEWQ